MDKFVYNFELTSQLMSLVEVPEGISAKAVAVTTVGGRVASLLHHSDETPSSLNYKRTLVSLLTPAHHSRSLVYHTQVTVLDL